MTATQPLAKLETKPDETTKPVSAEAPSQEISDRMEKDLSSLLLLSSKGATGGVSGQLITPEEAEAHLGIPLPWLRSNEPAPPADPSLDLRDLRELPTSGPLNVAVSLLTPPPPLEPESADTSNNPDNSVIEQAASEVFPAGTVTALTTAASPASETSNEQVAEQLAEARMVLASTGPTGSAIATLIGTSYPKR